MKKVTFPKVDLNCILQKADNITDNQCLNGIISRQSNGKFRFEETIRKGRAPRNPKLFDGNYVSMVRKQNGKYQFYMKTLADNFNRDNLAYSIYAEVSAAIQILN